MTAAHSLFRSGRELVRLRRFGGDDRVGLAELVEHRECLLIRRIRVDRLGQVRLDLEEQFPQRPGRETTSGAAQALQVRQRADGGYRSSSEYSVAKQGVDRVAESRPLENEAVERCLAVWGEVVVTAWGP